MLNKGFTLIELLIVMAILGVLAVVVLVAINPAEQLARTRDSGRVSAITQIGHAAQAYYTSHNAVYPTATTWGSALSSSGELSVVPGAITSTGYVACATGATSGWCYVTNATDTILYASLESQSYTSKCASGQTAYMLFSTKQGRGGTVCGNSGSEPVPAASYTFVN